MPPPQLRFSCRFASIGSLVAPEAEPPDHVWFPARLVKHELIDRERRMTERRIKATKFPATKSLDRFDFRAIPA